MDDALRDLERALAIDGSAPARLRLTRALERAGRRDDVAAVLLPVARRELACERYGSERALVGDALVLQQPGEAWGVEP